MTPFFVSLPRNPETLLHLAALADESWKSRNMNHVFLQWTTSIAKRWGVPPLSPLLFTFNTFPSSQQSFNPRIQLATSFAFSSRNNRFRMAPPRTMFPHILPATVGAGHRRSIDLAAIAATSVIYFTFPLLLLLLFVLLLLAPLSCCSTVQVRLISSRFRAEY